MQKNMLQTECDRYFFSHASQILQAAESLVLDTNARQAREILASRFEAGARWAMRETTQMNPAITKFIELVTLLGFADAKVPEGEGCPTCGQEPEVIEGLKSYCVAEKQAWEQRTQGQSPQFALGCCSAFMRVYEYIEEHFGDMKNASVEQQAGGGTETDSREFAASNVLTVPEGVYVPSASTRDDSDDMRPMQLEDC